jgi:hypothetical protein
MEIEHLIRYAPLAVGLKPSAMHGEARLRGLYWIMYSKTIHPRLCTAKPAYAERELQRGPSRPSPIAYRLREALGYPRRSPLALASTSLYKILRFLAWDGILCDMGKHTHIELTSEERTELEKLIRTGNAPARTHTRARILLLSDRSQGQKRTDQEVADAVLCCKNTVRNVRRRFLSGGLQAALSDKGWPGASPKFTGEVEAKLVMLACSEPPEGAARWTLRLLADKMVELHYVDSMSHVTVGEILKKTKSSRGE